jgi:hypothetical protein
MTEHSATDSMFEQIMALNRKGFEAGDYNTAYHLLAAALHTAQREHTARGLVQVEHIAQEQLA